MAALAIAVPAYGQPQNFDIKAGPTDEAVLEFALQAHVQIIAPTDRLKGHRSPAVRGSMSVREALERLLGSADLVIARIDGEVITLRPRSQPRAPRHRAAKPAVETADRSFSPDIVVTAQRRPELLQAVPESVAVLSSAQLRDMGAHQYADYLPAVPGVSYARNGAYKDKIFIRGLSDAIGSRVFSTTGVYLDDTPITEVDASLFDQGTFDVARTEVLRGPQGTLFGSGSMGGTIRIITNKPDLNRTNGIAQGSLSATQGGGLNTEFNAMVNVPLHPDAGLRIVASTRHDSGFIDNLVPGTAASGNNINSTDALGARVMFKVLPWWNLSVLLSFQYQHTIARSGPNVDIGLPAYSVRRYYPEQNRFTSKILSATLEYEAPHYTVTSVTSLIDKSNYSARDFTTRYIADYQAATGVAVPNEGYGLIYSFPNHAFVEELRIASKARAPLQWELGAYYNNFFPVQRQWGTSTAPDPTNVVFSSFEAHYHRREFALFGEATHEILPRLDATVGFRLARFDIQRSGFQSGVAYGGTSALDDTPVHQTAKVARYRLAYRIDDHHLLYALASQGFRPGELIGPFPPQCMAQLAAQGRGGDLPRSYAPDSLWNYEIGSKNQFLDGRMVANLSLYHIDWSRTQLARNLDCGFQFITNAAGAKVSGLELELQGRVTPNLSISSGLSYTSSSFNATDPTIGTLKGASLPNSPRWNGNIALDYALPLANAWVASLHGDIQYVGARISDLPLLPTAHDVPAYTMLNLRAGLSKGQWDVSLFVRNATNALAILNTFDASGLYYHSINTPRTIGAQVRTSF